MDDEYTYTVPTDDTVALESPVNDLRVMERDTDTEAVLDILGYVPDSEDQFENYGEIDIVLDSEDEDLVKQDDACGTRRLSGRYMIERRRTPTGYFRRFGNKSGERGCLYRDLTRNSRSGKESNASRTCLDNASRNQDYNVDVDCIISRLSDKQRMPEPESGQELRVNQENMKIVVENMTKDSIDKRHLSENRVMESDASYGLENVKLNQDESTEPIESQSKALDFVDKYLSLYDLGSFGNVEEAKQIYRIRSPPSLSSKGSLCLARKINLGFAESKYTNFDWVENPMENEGCSLSKTRKDSTFRLKGDEYEQSSVSKESGNVNVHIDQYEMDAFDVGLDTQIAAEAMQSLINSPLPSFDAQQSGNTLDSSTILYRRSRFKHPANPREAFIGWKNKSKRSKAVINPTRKVQVEASAQLPVGERLITHTLLSGNDLNITDLRFARNSNLEKSSDMIKSNMLQERRKSIDDHEDVSRLEFSKKCLYLNSDSSAPLTADKTKERNVNTGVAHSCGFSKLNKSACLPRSNRNCSPIVPGNENNAQTEFLVYNRRRKCSTFVPRNENNAETGSLVYNRRRKCSSERKHSGIASNASGSPSPIHIDIDAAKLSNQMHELEDVNISCSMDNSGTKKLNEQSNGNSSTFQVCELGDGSKYQCKHPFRSHPKKELTRLGHPKSSPAFLPKDSRKRRVLKKVCVLFSQNLDMNILSKQKKIVERLGFSIASCSLDATHFVADRFMRTRNMMEAIALGKPVVTHLWLESCDQAGYFIDEKSYILRDEKKEKEIGFSMPLTLARASNHSLLKGRRVFITTNVKPSVDVITCLVRAAQCQVVQNIRGAESKYGTIPRDLLILSSVEDYKICMPFLKKGASIYDSELLLNGILTQKLDYERHQIFKDFAESSRSLCCSPQRRKKRKSLVQGGLRQQLAV